jgi:hypothetical protein
MKYFFLGANIHQEALDLIRRAGDTVVLYECEDALHVTETLGQLERAGRAHSVDRSAVESLRRRPCGSSIDQRERIVRAVLGDFKVFLLRMRFLRVDHEGAFRGIGYFSDVVDYALTLAETHRPDTVFCAYTPHTVESWIIVRTFEELGAKVIRLIPSPLPWVLLPVQGLLNRTGCILIAKQRRPVNSLAINKYIDKLSGDYSAAMPYYEKLANRFSLARLLSVFKGFHPRDIVKQIEKWVVWREFQVAATSLPKETSFGVYFLHYQPEMNTLPEAELYCDQFQAVNKLAAALPEGVSLIVKEHPSTFSKRCDRRWRPAGFYARLLSLPNVRICPEEIGAFELIDRSMFVASIAGVCLTEALARGKPAVTFYSPRFDCFSDDLVIDANNLSQSELKAVLNDFIRGERRYGGVDVLIKCLKETSIHGYDGSVNDFYIPQSAEEQYEIGRRTNLEYLEDAVSDWFLSNEVHES